MENIPPELKTPNYRSTKLTGIGYDPALDRQDPSNVIKVGELYYVWYTQRAAGVHPFASLPFLERFSCTRLAGDWHLTG